MHDPVRVGTLSQIVRDVAEHMAIDRDEVIRTITK